MKVVERLAVDLSLPLCKTWEHVTPDDFLDSLPTAGQIEAGLSRMPDDVPRPG